MQELQLWSRAWSITLRRRAALPVVFAAALISACEQGSGSGAGSSGSGGAGGGGGACPAGPVAMFTMTIKAEDGPVPADLRVEVSWSVGKEPAFVLSNPETWLSLNEANLICELDRDKPPPVDLPELVCQAWTNGATFIDVSAGGYERYQETHAPEVSEACHGPLPEAIEIMLKRKAQDAGAP